jgi:hypothetical protein
VESSGHPNAPHTLSLWSERPVHFAQESVWVLQCGEEETFLSLPGFEHHPSASALVVSSCENENIRARFEILAAVMMMMMMMQVLSDVRHADW